MPLVELVEPDLRQLPFAIGKGPFRMKGTALRGALDFYDRLPGGLPRVRSAITDTRVLACFDAPILASGWYDVFLSVAIDFAAARAHGKPADVWLTESTVAQARAMLSGVYRTMLSLFTPGAMAWSIPRASGTFFDFGSMKTVDRGPTHYSGEIDGIPMPLIGWYQRVCGDFATEAMRVRGVPDASFDWSAPIEAGSAHGVRLCRSTLTFHWKD